MIGFELIDRLEYVHKKNLLYRDMKPENIMIGKEDDYRQLYLIDFGLAKLYKTFENKHIPHKKKFGMVGLFLLMICININMKNAEIRKHKQPPRL